MTTPLARVLVLLAAAAPAAAGADVSARAGVTYSDFTAYPVAGQSTSRPYLDIDLGLDASGVVASRDIARYQLRASWSRLQVDVPEATSTTQKFLSYSASASVLQNAVSPIGLRLFASRGENDFTTSGLADTYGSGTQTSAGGNVQLRGDRLPLLDLGYNRTDMESHIAGLPVRSGTIQTLSSSLSFGTGAFDMHASYAGELRDGTWDTDNYALHSVTLRANGWVGKNVITIESSSVVNVPKELVPGAFKQDSTSFSAFLNAGATGNKRSFSYSYGHTITESPGAPTGEISRQGVQYEGDHFRIGEFFTRWLVNASMDETRSDTTELRSTGQTAGVSLWWQRVTPTSTVELNAGPRVSMIEPAGEDARGGSGATAGARVTWPVADVHAFQLNWGASYGRDLFATAGWQLTQELGASLSGPLSTARYSVTLRGNSFRTHNPVLGEGAGRVLQLLGTVAGRRISFDGRATLSSGIIGSTPQQFAGDGLIVPAPFNSNVLDTSAGATFRIFSGLAASGRLHWARSDVPGRPALQEVGGDAALTYAFGGLGVSLVDRYTRTEVADGWAASNTFMATVYRSFNW